MYTGPLSSGDLEAFDELWNTFDEMVEKKEHLKGEKGLLLPSIRVGFSFFEGISESLSFCNFRWEEVQ